MTQFETLPNELIYFTFKYLYANDILSALTGLNLRFTALLVSYMDYKVDFRFVSKDVYDFVCSQMIPEHVQALYLSNKRCTSGQIQNFFNRFSLNSFSCRLRSLSLTSCLENGSKAIIDQLHLLTKLTEFSFVASASADITFDLRHQLVQKVSQLPYLKRCTIKIYKDILIFEISGLVFQTLEYVCLSISSLDQMVYLCRCAPNLKYLIIDAVISEPLNINDCSSLGNLTHLSMRTNENMADLERLLAKAQSLDSLSLVCSNDECQDGNRWQQILSKIKLSKFLFLFFTDPQPAMDSLINPFYEKFWLEHGWYIRYEQQKTNHCNNLYTLPYPISSFLLDLDNTSTVTMTRSVDAIQVFDSVRELTYVGYETKVSSNSNYFFPHVEILNLESDTLPPSGLISFEHVKELKLLQSQLTQDILNTVSMPTLTRLILCVLPATWTVSCLNRRIQYLELQTEGLRDDEVEEMCAPTSFAIHCKHISLPVQSKYSICLLLNRLNRLESVDFNFNEPLNISDPTITEDWVRDETSLRNFLLTKNTQDNRFGLWIGRSN